MSVKRFSQFERQKAARTENHVVTPDVTTPKSYVTIIPTVTSNMKPISIIAESQNLDLDAFG